MADEGKAEALPFGPFSSPLAHLVAAPRGRCGRMDREPGAFPAGGQSPLAPPRDGGHRGLLRFSGLEWRCGSAGPAFRNTCAGGRPGKYWTLRSPTGDRRSLRRGGYLETSIRAPRPPVERDV